MIGWLNDLCLNSHPAWGPRYRVFDDCLQRSQSIGQGRRARLQDQRRFDLVNRATPDCRYAIKARPIGYLVRAKLLAAPRPDNDIRLVPYNLFDRHDAILGRLARRTVGEDVD